MNNLTNITAKNALQEVCVNILNAFEKEAHDKPDILPDYISKTILDYTTAAFGEDMNVDPKLYGFAKEPYGDKHDFGETDDPAFIVNPGDDEVLSFRQDENSGKPEEIVNDLLEEMIYYVDMANTCALWCAEDDVESFLCRIDDPEDTPEKYQKIVSVSEWSIQSRHYQDTYEECTSTYYLTSEAGTCFKFAVSDNGIGRFSTNADLYVGSTELGTQESVAVLSKEETQAVISRINEAIKTQDAQYDGHFVAIDPIEDSFMHAEYECNVDDAIHFNKMDAPDDNIWKSELIDFCEDYKDIIHRIKETEDEEIYVTDDKKFEDRITCAAISDNYDIETGTLTIVPENVQFYHEWKKTHADCLSYYDALMDSGRTSMAYVENNAEKIKISDDVKMSTAGMFSSLDSRIERPSGKSSTEKTIPEKFEEMANITENTNSGLEK